MPCMAQSTSYSESESIRLGMKIITRSTMSQYGRPWRCCWRIAGSGWQSPADSMSRHRRSEISHHITPPRHSHAQPQSSVVLRARADGLHRRDGVLVGRLGLAWTRRFDAVVIDNQSIEWLWRCVLLCFVCLRGEHCMQRPGLRESGTPRSSIWRTLF